MDNKLRILIVEDSTTDAELLQAELRKAHILYSARRVETRESFLRELKDFAPDLVLSDYQLPHFDGMAALKLTQEVSPTTPLIIVTGSMNEETAVECMKAGAADYVIKEHLVRVGPAIRRALERKREQEEKARAEAQLKIVMSAIEQSANCVYITDKDGVLQYVNPGFEQTTGYSKAEAIGKTPRILKSGKHDVAFYKHLWQTILAGKVFYAEFINKKKDGSQVYQEETITPVLDDKGNITHFVASGRDVTERKQVEEALRSSEERYRNLVENINDIYYVSDSKGRLQYASPNLFSLSGYRREELLGQSYVRLIAKQDRRRVVDLYVRGAKEGKQDLLAEFRAQRKDEQIKWIEQATRIVRDRLGEVIEYRNVVRDITDRKRAEEAVRQAEEKYRGIFENAVVGIYQTALDGRYITANPTLARICGYESPKELMTAVVDLNTGLYVQSGRRSEFIRLVQERGTVLNFESQAYRKDGSVIWISETGRGMRDAGGKLVGFEGTTVDVTEGKRAEEALKKSEEKYRSLVSNINDGFFVADLEGKITFANEALAGIQGCKSKNDIIGKHFSDFIPQGLTEKMEEQRRRSRETGKFETLEMPFVKADGTTGFIELKPSPVFEGDKIIGDMGVIRDVTERKKLEGQIRQVQKMESIGTLAGGIAHDFNNILGIIMAYVTLLQSGNVKPEDMSLGLATILNAVQRGAMLVRQLLTFARKSDVTLSTVKVNNAVKELHKMLQETFTKTIEIRFDLDPSDPAVTTDPGQLHQALLNLCVNARDAILDALKQRPGEGVITMKTRLAAAEELPDRIARGTSGSYVAITVSDTGSGMSEETKEKVFEPFFTTKEQGQGTGLGLAVVYGIVKSHQGFIDVKSELNRGTDFTLYFPAARIKARSETPLTQRLHELPGGSETILLVEDETALMELLKNLLQNKGYTVLTATNGLEAVESFVRNKDMIDLVLSDFGLPKLSGAEAFKKMRQINPRVKTVLASGYIEPHQKSEILKSGVREVLQKPYEPQEVLRKVREVLDFKA